VTPGDLPGEPSTSGGKAGSVAKGSGGNTGGAPVGKTGTTVPTKKRPGAAGNDEQAGAVVANDDSEPAKSVPGALAALLLAAVSILLARTWRRSRGGPDVGGPAWMTGEGPPPVA